MDIREGDPTDSESITAIGRESLGESYEELLDAGTIDELVDEWYSEEALAEAGQDDNGLFLVASEDGTDIGFAHGRLVHDDPPAGELHWLHVAPSHRGEGHGRRLLGVVQDEFDDLGAAVLRGHVLTNNEAGCAFFADNGFERAGSHTVTIADEGFEEAVFTKDLDDDPDDQVIEAVEGQELFVNYAAVENGAKGPLFEVFLDRDLSERYGFRCGNCGSIDTTMDSTGRIACADCGNKRKAQRWDGSYL